MTARLADVATEDIDSVEALCDRWARAWNAHDGEAVAAMCAPDLVYDEPGLGDTKYGPIAIRDFVARMHQGFPDFSFTRIGLYAEVTRRAVLVAWRFNGTFARTGRPVEFHGDDRLELDPDGLISAYRCLYDNRFVLSQLTDANLTL